MKATYALPLPNASSWNPDNIRVELKMFAELNHILNASPEQLEQGKFTLVLDTKTDGSFLVHHFLSFYLKAGCKVCFLALAQSFSHYNIVAQKLGVNLTTAKDRGQLVFLEGLKSCCDVLFGEEHASRESLLQFLSKNGSDLKHLYKCVRTSLTPSKCPVLLIDDLGLLLSLGVKALHVVDFVHYCKATVCSQLKGNLVALAHCNDDFEDEGNELVGNFLRLQSSLVLHASGLATGFCKDVHGQLNITWKGPCHLKGEKNQSKIYQYKIQDKNVSFFARGLSSAVL
ncbi:elongator complex protein 6 [Ambystoma mexicanum]|uniref:elongator complex protein 6 n=1 Tax=Ambystoma mexicanum TaxID=8296 RepID=UPI0037E992DB